MTNDKDSAEYTKLLNEVITLRWKCGAQAAEIAALRQPTQSDALKIARDALYYSGQAFRIYVQNLDPKTATKADKGYAMTFDILAKKCSDAHAGIQEQSK